MTAVPRPTFDQRLKAALTEDGGRVPVVVGLCGAGRTSALRRLRLDLGADRCHYVNVERTATTPERFLAALMAGSPFVAPAGAVSPATPRQAFEAFVAYLSGARRADGGRATFLLDGALEFRTFESFPGLNRALPELLTALGTAPNRFVLASRYVTRMQRALADASPRFVVMPVPALADDQVAAMLADRLPPGDARAESSGPAVALGDVAQTVQRLCDGRPAYVSALVDMMAALGPQGGADPVAAMAALFEPDGRLTAACAFSYELRLHRARGYGALKAILDVLSTEPPLTLTEVSQRLGRTPGSTKDYLSWLEDVDLVAVQQRRYRFRDPVLRLWVRLHCHPMSPDAETVAREVQAFAATCLPDQPDTAPGSPTPA